MQISGEASHTNSRGRQAIPRPSRGPGSSMGTGNSCKSGARLRLAWMRCGGQCSAHDHNLSCFSEIAADELQRERWHYPCCVEPPSAPTHWYILMLPDMVHTSLVAR